MSPSASALNDVLPLLSRYRLKLAVSPARGLPGDHLSRASGSSVEFHDFRHYVPGDDPRHIDWAAVARTDQLIVRLHRAELRLSVEILLDASRSIDLLDGVKATRARQCTYLLAALAQKAGARTTIWVVGDTPFSIREDFLQRLSQCTFDGRLPLAETLERGGIQFEQGSIRIVVSDFLFPHDPVRFQGHLAAGAGAVALLQLLGRDEENPLAEGNARFLDVETGEEREIVLNASVVRAYQTRLQRLQEGLTSVCQATHAPFVRLAAEESIDALASGPLVSGAVLEPS